MIIALVIIAAIAIVIAPDLGGLGIASGLFNQEECKSPCWQGLTPEPSTTEDVDGLPTPDFGGLSLDSGLFDKEGCIAPCWHGLTPGQSTSEDVDDFLANLSQSQ